MIMLTCSMERTFYPMRYTLFLCAVFPFSSTPYTYLCRSINPTDKITDLCADKPYEYSVIHDLELVYSWYGIYAWFGISCSTFVGHITK